MDFKCPHCNSDFELDNKTGSVRCKYCHCIFRMVLVKFDGKCYEKMFPEIIKELKRMRKDNKEKGKRGRKPKNEN